MYIVSIDYSELIPNTLRFPVSLFLSNCSLSSHANANKYCFGCHATVNVAASIGISVILNGIHYNKIAKIITGNKYLKLNLTFSPVVTSAMSTYKSSLPDANILPSYEKLKARTGQSNLNFFEIKKIYSKNIAIVEYNYFK